MNEIATLKPNMNLQSSASSDGFLYMQIYILCTKTVGLYVIKQTLTDNKLWDDLSTADQE